MSKEVVEEPVAVEGKVPKTRGGLPKIFKKITKPKPKPKPKPHSAVAKTIKEFIKYEQGEIETRLGKFPEGAGDETFRAIEAVDYNLARIEKAKRILAYVEG